MKIPNYIYLTIVAILLVLLISVLTSKNPIKNEGASVQEEPGTEVSTDSNQQETKTTHTLPALQQDSLYGFWVGAFRGADHDNMPRYGNSFNLINISIDKIEGDTIIGHSVVAGNDRPFKGSIKKISDDNFEIVALEPGDDKFDGKFSFAVKRLIKDGNSWYELSGVWEAYKKVKNPKRYYSLKKRHFQYDPNASLSNDFYDWEKPIKADTVEYDEGEFDILESFATTTDAVYKINASNRLLSKEDVENLSKGDLSVIRNAIYARHGYSFKKRPLRAFFDLQPWYIPVHANIRSSFTDIEKQNIQLLLRYEEHAAEYYDSFGRL